MKSLLEMLAGIIWFIFILALFFIFNGEPDLWDKWHALAMQSAESSDCVRF